MNTKFEPLQPVLARNYRSEKWRVLHFSHIEETGGDGSDREFKYQCGVSGYIHCIPYNDDTKHLLGTKEPYAQPVDEATRFKRGELIEAVLAGVWLDSVHLGYCKINKQHNHRVFVIGREVVYDLSPLQVRKKAQS